MSTYAYTGAKTLTDYVLLQNTFLLGKHALYRKAGYMGEHTGYMGDQLGFSLHQCASHFAEYPSVGII